MAVDYRKAVVIKVWIPEMPGDQCAPDVGSGHVSADSFKYQEVIGM